MSADGEPTAAERAAADQRQASADAEFFAERARVTETERRCRSHPATCRCDACRWLALWELRESLRIQCAIVAEVEDDDE